MTKEEFISKLKEYELDQHLSKFESLMKPCVRLHLVPSDEDFIKIGQSKMGGCPDLPDGINWLQLNKYISSDKNNSYSFIAQINLAEITKFDTQNLLPKSGVLYFFYCNSSKDWAFDDNNRTKFKVLYHDSERKLLRNEFPQSLPKESRFKACSLTAKQEISLPTYFSEEYECLSEDEADNFYENILEGDSINKMLGYSDNIQDEMEIDCEWETHELFRGDPLGYDDPLKKELETRSKDWLLLLQVDSNVSECGMMWGDLGRLYFWIRKQDLQQKQFDKCYVILQSS